MKPALPLSVSPRAEAAAHEAARWYEGRSQGLGGAFLEILDQTLVAVQENPLHCPIVHRDIRRALLKRFPYGVFFRVRSDHIRILTVMHLSRNPDRWRRL